MGARCFLVVFQIISDTLFLLFPHVLLISFVGRYNAPGTDIWELAKNYNKRFEDRYRRIRNECTYIF